jgi:hypothetical protein
MAGRKDGRKEGRKEGIEGRKRKEGNNRHQIKGFHRGHCFHFHGFHGSQDLLVILGRKGGRKEGRYVKEGTI